MNLVELKNEYLATASARGATREEFLKSLIELTLEKAKEWDCDKIEAHHRGICLIIDREENIDTDGKVTRVYVPELSKLGEKK